MSFVYPWFLWALLSLAIPIIVHLFDFRRAKTVYFSNVRFLRELQEEQSARNKLKHWLVLASRLLALAFLVLAFAMPYWSNPALNRKQGGRDASIYLDNSFSMSAEQNETRLLEQARRRAEEILAAFGPEDKVQILTADFEGRDQRLLSKEDALQRLREVRTTFRSPSFSKILLRQKQALSRGDNPNKDIFILSDFQENAFDLDSVWTDTSLSLNLVYLNATRPSNLGIDTAWFESPVQALNQPNTLIVKTQNYGNRNIEQLRLSLEINGQERPQGLISLEAGSSRYDTIRFSVDKTGWHEARLRIEDQPISFDNDYYFSFYVSPKVRLLEIQDGSSNRFLRAAFADNPYFALETQALNQLDYANFRNFELIILQDLPKLPSGLASELQTYVRGGGNVLIFPNPQVNLGDMNKLLLDLGANTLEAWEGSPRQVSYINYDEFIFREVFEDRRDNLKLPASQGNFRLARRASSAEEVILRYRDGQSFVGKYLQGRGHLYLCSAPLDKAYSNLVEQAEIFVPMIYRMALSSGQSRPIAHIIGQSEQLEANHSGQVASNQRVYRMANRDGEFIPEQRIIASRLLLGLNGQVQTAGTYDLFLQRDSVLDKFSFNFDRRESDMRFLSQEDLLQRLGKSVVFLEGGLSQDFASLVSIQHQGKHYWRHCLVFCLIFLLSETLLLRLWKPKNS